MSKPNTQHIIGFAVKQYSNIPYPAIVDVNVYASVYEMGVFEPEVFE